MHTNDKETSVQVFRVSIHKCARCKQDHYDLTFNIFTGSPIEDSDGTIWSYWALCPITGEPILLKKQEK